MYLPPSRSLLSSNLKKNILNSTSFFRFSFFCISWSQERDIVHGKVLPAAFPSHRPLHPSHLGTAADCFKMSNNMSTDISARRMLLWKLRKNCVFYMQSNYKHICICSCPFVFSLGCEMTVSVGTLNQAVIWYLFGKMSIDIFDVIESSVLSGD